MAERKANYLVTLVFHERTDIRKQVDTEYAVESYIRNGLQHAIVGKEIKHFVIANDEVINKKLTEEHKVGYWIRKPIKNEKGGCIGAEMICSCCNKDNRHDEYMDYCPNCGAEMMEAKNGNN